jgi:hypothetical protein
MDEEEQLQPMIEQVPVDEEEDDDGNAGGLDHPSDDCLGLSSSDHLVATSNSSNSNSGSVEQTNNNAWTWQRVFHSTLLPDNACTIRNMSIVEGPFTIKLFKFVLFTFFSIGFVHWIVSHRSEHRDVHLNFWEIWVFDGNLIASDCVVFFLVGRLWKQKGVDHLAWIGMVVFSNLYFESQHYISFLKHSLTLYEMSCGTYYIFVDPYITVYAGSRHIQSVSHHLHFLLLFYSLALAALGILCCRLAVMYSRYTLSFHLGVSNACFGHEISGSLGRFWFLLCTLDWFSLLSSSSLVCRLVGGYAFQF